MVAPGKGLIDVIVGATPTIVRLKFLGLVPSALLAVTAMFEVPVTVGFPVSKPEEESEAQTGSPVAVHVIGTVPFAANWKE